MAQQPKDLLSALTAYERAREREEASRARRRADLARRHEQAQASLYLIEAEALQEGYEMPASAFRGVYFHDADNRDDNRGNLDGAVELDNVGGADAIDLRVARREEMLRGVPVGGIAGGAHNIHGVFGAGAGRGNGGTLGGRAGGVILGQMPVNEFESSRYWRKQYFQLILGGGGGGGGGGNRGPGNNTRRRGRGQGQINKTDKINEQVKEIDVSLLNTTIELSALIDNLSRFKTPNEWASITYYEKNNSIGTFTSNENIIIVNGSTGPSLRSRFCIGNFGDKLNKQQEFKKARSLIRAGVKFFYDGNDVFVTNNSATDLFVHPLGLNKYNNRTDNIILFIVMSFTNGWGFNRSINDITAIPCWLEIKLHIPIGVLESVLGPSIKPPANHQYIHDNLPSIIIIVLSIF
ncbi:hypothetical protein HCN44_008738 [Aphidius gifuensis]|uniref:MH2 domain-containing protein n=1 Tax=Aphidius gifuensis TaxID=684658 RepID=A0A834XYL7_APHGI|nr:hypothetical protein HCN44_008738 [Aphidius gifuensis]